MGRIKQITNQYSDAEEMHLAVEAMQSSIPPWRGRQARNCCV
jgi:hypothetical protein